jgi:hypothetical protein
VKRTIGTKGTEFVREVNKRLQEVNKGYRLLQWKVAPVWAKNLLRRNAFQNIYKKKMWGEGTGNETFFSGLGSRGHAANAYVEKLSDELNRIACEKGKNIIVVDLGCGDFSIGHALVERVPSISYVGCDIVPEIIAHHVKQYANDLVRFQQIDIVADALPQGDVCLIRQVLQHLPNDDVKQVLAKCEQYRVVFVTEGQPLIIEGPANPDKPVGPDVRFNYQAGTGRGLQLDQQPFGLATREILRVMASDTEYVSTVEIRPGATV